ncbi:MAG: beta-glycosidase, partial [Porphyromonadaceae bacterium]|nr:beta-glycosidase [Porphyromonadaceae bacterium]
VQYTYNGLGYSNMGGKSNLKEDCYDDFASYMADVAQHYIGLGYPVTHISPVNEPQYDWGDGSDQEGSGWTNAEVAKLAKEMDSALSDRGLSTDILLGEAGDWEYLYKTKSDSERSNVIYSFFDPASSNYVGDLQHVNNLICAHSYWTDGTWSGMQSVRSSVASAAESAGVDLWQSEWSMLGDDYSTTEFVGYDNATTMDIALYMSKVIHNDLTVAGVTSWCFWTSMDVARWGHQNRFLLISLVPKGGVEDDNSNIDQEGSYTATATLWVLGNYSRFIRPGYRRIALDLSESRSFFGSAWISPSGDEIVAVYSNLSSKGVRLNETHVDWGGDVKSITTYTTSGSKNLAPATVSPDDQVVIDAESVTTVVYSLK